MRRVFASYAVKIVLVAGLICPFLAVAQKSPSSMLVENSWWMTRATSLGKVTTILLFDSNGEGLSVQKIVKNGSARIENHGFSYTFSGSRLTIQEDIDEEWKGILGVTRWTIDKEKLLGDIRFRGKQIVFDRIQ